jgi:hypothetical protein
MIMRTRLNQAQSMPSLARRVSRCGARRAVLPAALLGLLAAACGQRYELGEVEQSFDQVGVGSDGTTESIGVLIADGPEDVDVEVGIGTQTDSYGDDRLGDVDGDGYDDWITDAFQLVYGGPRVTGDMYPEAGAPVTTFSFASGAEPSPSQTSTRDTTALEAHPAGDVDGDGRADILFGSRRMAFGPTVAPEYWPTQRAYLWYGRKERPSGEVRLQDEGVEFEPLHAVREAIAGTEPAVGDQTLRLMGVGDIDADGFDDLAYSYTFLSSIESPTTETAQSVTLIYYGSSQRLPARGASALDDARLSDIQLASAMGDIDGDGSAEFYAAPFFGESAFVVSGSAQRLSGEISSSALGLPFDAAFWYSEVHAMGDLDGDGIDDFMIDDANLPPSPSSFLFYGSPSWATTAIDRSLADAIFHFDEGIGDVMPLGDWNGDGFNDLMLWQRVRRDAVPGVPASAAEVTAYQAVWRGEARVIPGAAQRYAGDYATTEFRPELRALDVGELGGPYSVYPIGDLDGDGFGDVQLALAPYQTDVAVRVDYQTFIKYGGAFTAVIH